MDLFRLFIFPLRSSRANSSRSASIERLWSFVVDEVKAVDSLPTRCRLDLLPILCWFPANSLACTSPDSRKLDSHPGNDCAPKLRVQFQELTRLFELELRWWIPKLYLYKLHAGKIIVVMLLFWALHLSFDFECNRLGPVWFHTDGKRGERPFFANLLELIVTDLNTIGRHVIHLLFKAFLCCDFHELVLFKRDPWRIAMHFSGIRTQITINDESLGSKTDHFRLTRAPAFPEFASRDT